MRVRRGALGIAVLACAALVALLAIDVTVRLALLGHLYADPDAAPAAPVTLVLGAEVYPDGRPSPALGSRLEVAIDLWRMGKTRTLLMSGGNGTFEVGAMRTYAIAHGVPGGAILMDGGGERTLASCLGARDAFRLDRVLIVSQVDHLARATYTCRGVGLDADGVAAPEFTGDRLLVYQVRERFALVLAWWEVVTSRGTR